MRFPSAFLATALSAVLTTMPMLALADPSYASNDEHIAGRIASFDGSYNLQVRDDRGYVDNVELHQGTIINPTGLTLEPGMIVSIVGYSDGDYFDANEIDTPYQYYGDVPYYAGHPWNYYGAGFALGFFFATSGWWYGGGHGYGYGWGHGYPAYARGGYYGGYGRGGYYGGGYGRGGSYGGYGHGGYSGAVRSYSYGGAHTAFNSGSYGRTSFRTGSGGYSGGQRYSSSFARGSSGGYSHGGGGGHVGGGHSGGGGHSHR